MSVSPAVLRKMVDRKRDGLLRKAYYEVGIRRALAALLETIVSEDGVSRAMDAYAAYADRDAEERMLRALVASFDEENLVVFE